MSDPEKEPAVEANEDEELAAMFDLKQKKKKKTKKVADADNSANAEPGSSSADLSSSSGHKMI